MENAQVTEKSENFAAARFIKVIGRGKDGARSLSRSDAHDMYAAMLDRRISDLELGGILLSMRIKGESVDEIAGFLDAAEASFEQLSAPGDSTELCAYAPIVIPSYNGARKMANLTPLLALLLAREGVPVLVHGVTQDPGRVTTAEIFTALGLRHSENVQQAQACFARHEPAFMPIGFLAPAMARLLETRRILGVRNSTHTLVKIMQPFKGPALRLVSYTHPEYLAMLSSYFATAAPFARGDAFLMRGTEGETVANARRSQQIDWYHASACVTLVQTLPASDAVIALPEERDASSTALWTEAVLRQEQPVPATIAEQVKYCLQVSRQLQADPLAR
ncbi:MAG: DNA-binding protein YbiB [Burkholderiaceae bacterium]